MSYRNNVYILHRREAWNSDLTQSSPSDITIDSIAFIMSDVHCVVSHWPRHEGKHLCGQIVVRLSGATIDAFNVSSATSRPRQFSDGVTVAYDNHCISTLPANTIPARERAMAALRFLFYQSRFYSMIVALSVFPTVAGAIGDTHLLAAIRCTEQKRCFFYLASPFTFQASLGREMNRRSCSLSLSLSFPRSLLPLSLFLSQRPLKLKDAINLKYLDYIFILISRIKAPWGCWFWEANVPSGKLSLQQKVGRTSSDFEQATRNIREHVIERSFLNFSAVSFPDYFRSRRTFERHKRHRVCGAAFQRGRR